MALPIDTQSASQSSRARPARGVLLALAACFAVAQGAAAAPFAYVAGTNATVAVVDTQTNTVVATRTVSDPRFGSFMAGGVVTRDGGRLYVAASGGRVATLSTANQRVLGTLPTGKGTFSVAVSPNGARVYAVNSTDNTVSVVDTGTQLAVATIPVGRNPTQIDVSPDGTRAYVANLTDSSVSVIDTAKNMVIATQADVISPQGIAVSPTGTRVYVSGMLGLSIIDATMNTLIGSITLPMGLAGSVAVSPDGRRVYVADTGNGRVYVVDTVQASYVTVAVGTQPFGVAVTPDGRRVFVSNGQSNDLSVIDAATNTVIATVPLGLASVAVAHFIGPTHFCGDGTVDRGEACDAGDGNGTPESCCRDDCTVGTVCTDDDPCTVGDSCQGATCQPGDRICQTATTNVAGNRHTVVIRFEPTDGVGGGQSLVGALGGVPTGAPAAEPRPLSAARDLCASLASPDLMPVTRCVTRRFGRHARAVRLSVGLNPVGRKLLKRQGSLDVTVQTTLMDRRGRRATLRKVLRLVR